jgi:1-acyl-sn-glycerol-3-phosphate acyltransferase
MNPSAAQPQALRASRGAPACRAAGERVLRLMRACVRIVWLASEIMLAALTFLVMAGLAGRSPSLAARARWLQRSSRRVLRIFKLRLETTGPAPTRGLLVANHLSYLDILVLAAVTPAVFVSKSDVKQWPVFGRLARLAGTLFIDRRRRSDVARLAAEMRRVLDSDLLLVLFPEGTSSNGQGVLPFKSALLQPVAGAQGPLSVAHLSYTLPDGDAGEEVCYWRDMTFAPHLLNLLTKRSVSARVRFAAVEHPAADRKELARQLRAEVERFARPS